MLLSSEEARVFEIINPEGKSDFLLVCDHASNRVPKSLNNLGLTDDQLNDHIAWDPGAAIVARKLSQLLDATLVVSGYSRLVIDCNRALISPQLIAQVSDGIKVPANQNLTDTERQQRIDTFFKPYHHAINSVLEQRKGRDTILLSIHSFSPALAEPDKNTARPWHIGLSFKEKAKLTDHLYAGLIKDKQLCVGYHLPYAVDEEFDYTLIEHGFKRNLEHGMIEVRQDQLVSEEAADQWAQKIYIALIEI